MSQHIGLSSGSQLLDCKTIVNHANKYWPGPKHEQLTFLGWPTKANYWTSYANSGAAAQLSLTLMDTGSKLLN